MFEANFWGGLSICTTQSCALKVKEEPGFKVQCELIIQYPQALKHYVDNFI